MDTEVASPGWTIDELASLSDVPSRTIREYQRLELLPPPTRDGRVGRYGHEHRARLSIIGRLQDRGYSLAAIGDLIGSWEEGRGLGSVLGVDANPAVLDELPTQLTNAQLAELVPCLSEPDLVEYALSAGILHTRDGALVVRSLAAVELLGLAVGAGVPARDAIDMVEGMQAGATAVAAAAVAAFSEQLWPPHADLDLAAFLSRARLLTAQASASLVVHELGTALRQLADHDDSGELATAIDRIAIGRIRTLVDTAGATG